jgi:hypothetical protein
MDRTMHVDLTRDELVELLGAPTAPCDCGRLPPCFFQWHVREFDAGLEAHVTHHAVQAGRTEREGRVDLAVPVPRAK